MGPPIAERLPWSNDAASSGYHDVMEDRLATRKPVAFHLGDDQVVSRVRSIQGAANNVYSSRVASPGLPGVVYAERSAADGKRTTTLHIHTIKVRAGWIVYDDVTGPAERVIGVEVD